MHDKVPLTKQLINEYDKTHASILAVKKVPHDEVSAYGVIDPEKEVSKGLFNVKKLLKSQLLPMHQVTWPSLVVTC